MINEREAELDRRFRAAVSAIRPGSARAATEPVVPGSRYSAADVLELFDAQVASRHLDLAARRLTAAGQGYYSIGSSGHEGNVALAEVLAPTDPALLHYRSGAFFVRRCRRVPGLDPIRDVLLGVVAAATDPISGGRHKVFGSAPAAVIPQTSTIASHLPRAVGLAFALDRATRLGRFTAWPSDSVILCTFGDASANHSTAVGAINTAVHTAHQQVPMPVLFVCEDNGIGISVRTPPDWIQQAYGSRPGLRYFEVDGTDLLETLSVCDAAARWVRENRLPAFLRLRTTRLLGHAGSDVESAYRRAADIDEDLRRDPVTATGRLLVAAGAATGPEVIARYDAVAAEVAEIAEQVQREPKLTTAAAVTATLAPHHPDRIRADALRTRPLPHPAPPTETGILDTRRLDPADLNSAHREGSGDQPAAEVVPADKSPESAMRDSAAAPRMTLGQAINHTLGQLLERDGDVLVFGEDVGRKGGVYGVTKGLQRAFGARRVFDTLLDEQSVLGTALGAALAGFVPIPEIQYLAYVHNALDQIRGEAATLPFFSDGQYRNPMVVRIASYAYQRGFGGHFHNDNSVAAVRDIPGVVIASPARADDAAGMLRTCVSAARVDGRVCLYLEPIALYHTRDLHALGDEGWLATPTAEPADLGRARIYGDGTDLTIVTFANGVLMSLRAAHRLSERGIHARVLDLRWLAPLPVEDLLRHARATGRVLIADETRRTGGVSEPVCAALLDGGFTGAIARVTSEDSFVPLGPATAAVLLDDNTIETAATKLVAM
ncbi:thiamine pyrophosphate-dependent enzyme [Nocardia albiluteola]|uniref:thiamine pyrophosphate-dependent enzyme n=1 Tax=Nocardia albiluteola TaxID=2842303 RepID=UPI0027E20D98|nr:thiamine pyrophosphate-dependent enzyme [Nocardia albiluteola]